MKPQHTLVNGFTTLLYGRLLGRGILPWTVDDPQTARGLLRFGVRRFISNDPGKIREALGLNRWA